MKKPRINKIQFKEYFIHVIEDDEGAVIWVSLQDLCRVLKRREMMTNGKAEKLCTSATGFPLYSNGKLFLFVNIPDVLSLIKNVRGENKMIAKICDDLTEWVARLPLGRNSDQETLSNSKKLEKQPIKENVGNDNEVKIISQPAPKKKLEKQPQKKVLKKLSQEERDKRAVPVIYEYGDNTISFKSEDGKIYYNATQMAKSFGKNPREWLLLAETTRFRESLVLQGKSQNLESQIMTTRGHTGATWIEESLGIEFSRWLSPEFSLWCDSRVKELVTQGYTTMPKEEGQFQTSYGVMRKPPGSMKEALQLLLEQEEEIEKRNKKIEEDRPKVEYYDNMIGNRESFSTTFIAMELNISVIQLNKFLLEERIVKYEKKYYAVYPNYDALQCNHPYYWTNKNGKTYAYSHGKRWTHAGREYIIELYRQKNPLKLLR